MQKAWRWSQGLAQHWGFLLCVHRVGAGSRINTHCMGHRGSRGAGGKHEHGSLPCFTCWGYGAGLLPALLAALPHLCFFFFPQLSSQLWPPSHPLLRSHQLLFQVCRTSVSWMPCLSACSSRKSNMYLMASGSALPRCTVLNSVSNKSSTNFCSVP